MKPIAAILVALMTASCASTQENSRHEGAASEPLLSPAPQTTCPVMDGKRINDGRYVDYHGYRIYVCCGPCVKAVRKEPEKYLRKLLAQGVLIENVREVPLAERNSEGSKEQDGG